MTKQRLSASVDEDLIEAAEDAVSQRRVESVSAWVNEALRSKLTQDRRLNALASFIADYESDHGAITPEEMIQAERRARARAVVVRGVPPGTRAVVRKQRRAG